MSMLLEQFYNIFDTPESIQKLQEFILDMAFKGKLVPKDSDYKSVSTLLEKIKMEKELLIKEKKIKREKPLLSITEKEKPYELPNGWVWERLGVITIYGNNKQSKPDDIDDNVWILELEDIEKNTSRIIQRITNCEREVSSNKNVFKKNNVLYGKLRPYLNKVVIADSEGVCSSEIIPINTLGVIDSRYLMYYLKSPYFIQHVNNLTYGTKMPRLGTEDARKTLVPIPSLKVQKHIVEKVDQLMNLCEELKKRLEKKQRRENKLNISAFSSLEQSLTPRELMENLQFILTNLSSLCTDTKHVEQLRNVILSLAVKGKLVLQNFNDEPASILLEKIKAEKERLIEEKKIKREKPFRPIAAEEKDYELPKGWEWTRLGTIIHLISGQHLTPDQYNIEGKGIPYLTGPSDFQDGRALITKWTEIPKVVVEKNDILITVKGSGVGKSIILNVSNTSIGRQLMAIRPVLTDKNYIYMFIELYKKKINDASIGIAIPGISRGDLLNLMIPLPPLNEQKRIVEKISQLMSLCGELEKQIENTNAQKEYLIQSIAHQELQQDKKIVEA
ncbi:restriction endonuclease subunit S [Bacillus thuringiensis]|uniref:restriction endonuclease subunit S n=1 Tax=Bacillus thuringiensis TaxID=1428 RepID=UPI000BF55377|nr:restriction endonuclease subunit S [Bacillus thuringiensis]PES34154.1 restriction endonuclease [Bacillus thuringiensis]